MPVEIEISQSEDFDHDDDEVPQLEQFQQWVDAAFLSDEDAVVSMQLLSKGSMQTLNGDFSGEEKPTNVLSFPMQLPDQVGINLLGDLALCADVINDEAEQQNKSTDAHWAHMVVHGMLHLQGYDHMQEDEAKAMELLEVQILEGLGIANPYDTIL